MERITWEEFRKNGMLFFVNTFLHFFGLAIVFEINNDNHIIDVYPAKVNYRGFDKDSQENGFKQIHSYLDENIKKIKKITFDN